MSFYATLASKETNRDRKSVCVRESKICIHIYRYRYRVRKMRGRYERERTTLYYKGSCHAILT